MEVRCIPLGGDPLSMNIRQFCNLAYVTFLESLPEPLLDANDTRKKFIHALAWPEDLEIMQTAEEDQMTRESAGTFGSGGTDDQIFTRAWEERQRLLAEREARANPEAQAITTS